MLDETFTRLFGGSPFAEAERFCSAVLRARDAEMVRAEPITTERFTRAYRLETLAESLGYQGLIIEGSLIPLRA